MRDRFIMPAHEKYRSARAAMIESLEMLKNQLNRREVLAGLAAASLFPSPLKSESPGSSLCFMSAVEMARLIRTKKLGTGGDGRTSKAD
jgi:hypothetical protein